MLGYFPDRAGIALSMVFDDEVADISRSRTIAAGPQAIWEALADFGALSSWASNVDHSSIMNDGLDGGMWGTTRRVQMGRNTVVETITEFDAPTALTYDITGLPRRLGHLANRWTLRPENAVTATNTATTNTATTNTATTVTVTSRVDIGRSPLAAAAEWVVCRIMARQSDSMLAGLARRMENTHG